MRAPSERDQCQAKLDILVDGFIRDDDPAYRDAVAWLRDFTKQRNIDAGRVAWGGRWSTPQKIEAKRERTRMQHKAPRLRPKGPLDPC
jgi:hypothetical protein